MKKMFPRKESLDATRKLAFGVAVVVLLDAFIAYSGLQDVATMSAQQGKGLTAFLIQLLFPYFGKSSIVILRVGFALFFLVLAFMAHLQFKREPSDAAQNQ